MPLGRHCCRTSAKPGASVAHDVLINKAATIERCVARAREEYQAAPDSFADDFTRQDAAILNIQRACEAALDMGQHLIMKEKLGVPQSARDVFALLARGQWIDTSLVDPLLGKKTPVGLLQVALRRQFRTEKQPTTPTRLFGPESTRSQRCLSGGY